MDYTVEVEVIGFEDSSCGPFPCDETRSCGLEKCHPTENLKEAFDALSERLSEMYGEVVHTKLVLLDDGVPEYIQEIVEARHPPVPIILINGKLTPIGRISLGLISEEINRIKK